MKKIFISAMIAVFGIANAQSNAFKGAGDTRYQIGANLQNGGTGIMTSLDFGLGESFSIGAQAGYLLGAQEITGSTNLHLEIVSILKQDSMLTLEVC